MNSELKTLACDVQVLLSKGEARIKQGLFEDYEELRLEYNSLLKRAKKLDVGNDLVDIEPVPERAITRISLQKSPEEKQKAREIVDNATRLAERVRAVSVPEWYSKVGIIGLFLVLAFFMGFEIVAEYVKITPDAYRIMPLIPATIAALSVYCLGGVVSAKGQLQIPFIKEQPIVFRTSGGIAALIIVWILGYYLLVRTATP